jgi:hypothetical protein
MVNDPDRHVHKTGKHRKPDPWKIDQPEEQREKKDEEKETFTSKLNLSQSTNMQVRALTQLLFEAFNTWTCVDVHKT